MDQNDFIAFVARAAWRAVQAPQHIGHLVLTQTTPNGEPKLREPEMRHALAQEAEKMGIWYGIEAPTTEAYRFVEEEGERARAARHDFVVVRSAEQNADRANLLELKKDQPEISKVRKDFQKLHLERASDGKSMLHFLHAADQGTLHALVCTYNQAIREARQRAIVAGLQEPGENNCWFELFMLIIRHRNQKNQPVLLHQAFDHFGQALQLVGDGQDIFQEGALEVVPWNNFAQM